MSESSVYRTLEAADLITSPVYVLMSASDAFQHPTRRVHEMWQTDFTYFRIVHWSWYYLSTVLDDYSRYIIAWKLRSTMGASDVTEKLDGSSSPTAPVCAKLRSDKSLSSVLSNGRENLCGRVITSCAQGGSCKRIHHPNRFHLPAAHPNSDWT